MVARADVVHMDDSNDLFQLLADLIENPIVADNDERHPRKVRIFRLADGQRIDVVAARGEHARNVRQHARHILHHRRQHMTHHQTPSAQTPRKCESTIVTFGTPGDKDGPLPLLCLAAYFYAMLIGLTYDLRHEYLAAGFSEDETAEFDRADTIQHLEAALRQLGHETDRIGHAQQLV